MDLFASEAECQFLLQGRSEPRITVRCFPNSVDVGGNVCLPTNSSNTKGLEKQETLHGSDPGSSSFAQDTLIGRSDNSQSSHQ